jgi:heme/copper-type cytochrome/quinol oxidase subunit 2
MWLPRSVGVYPFYCTDFCSALHQEMQGYVRVSPKGSKVELAWNSPTYKGWKIEEDEDETHESKEHGGKAGR